VAGSDSTFMNRVHLATAIERAEESQARQTSESQGQPPKPGEGDAHHPERGVAGAFAGLKKLFGRDR
jgi:hypothetical protein